MGVALAYAAGIGVIGMSTVSPGVRFGLQGKILVFVGSKVLSGLWRVLELMRLVVDFWDASYPHHHQVI